MIEINLAGALEASGLSKRLSLGEGMKFTIDVYRQFS